jgi:fructose-1,6-bisphosphatase/sedoheptulose 1,7-bisphosphatase-like protein
MNISNGFVDLFVKTTSEAAYASSLLKGKGDKIAADQAAVDKMRLFLNNIPMKGKIVIGEGEMDEAPMLYINELVGTGTGEERLGNAVEQSIYGGLFGGAGAVASDVIGAAWNGGRSLAQKASAIYNRARQPQSNITVTTTGAINITIVLIALIAFKW